MSAGLVLPAAAFAADQVPRTLPFKKTVTLATPGTYTFRFSIHDAASQGNELWHEEKVIRLATKTLSHDLGSVEPFTDAVPSPLDFSDQYWVQVGYLKRGVPTVLGSRVKLVPVPYALWSATADTLAIECAAGQFLVADAEGKWACGSLPSAQLCSSGDLLACYSGPAGTLRVGVCTSGYRSCESGAWGTCLGEVLPSAEVCNGVDDDCDAASADGSEDPQNGVGCDGPDSDLCSEGTRSCAGGALVCGDATGGTVDLCNGVDDDCDNVVDEGCP